MLSREVLRRIVRHRAVAVLLAAVSLFLHVPLYADENASPPVAPPPPELFAAETFAFEKVVKKAEALAARPFENPDGAVPDFLLNISYDQWRKIRFRPEMSLWRNEKLPFEAQFFHPGLFYNRLVGINIVHDGGALRLPFSTTFFEYGDNAFASKTGAVPLDFTGFRLHFPLNRDDYKDEAAVFLGASYFRAVARGTQYGLSARGLAVDTAMQSGEEFPYFREFWIEKPAPDAQKITVCALLDSQSLTGAYRFILTPGEETVMDVECALFLRKDVQKIGLAPLTSMYLYGEPENGRDGDFRPEVHDSDGLLFRSAEGEWTWRPLANPKRLAVLSVPLPNPRGFGLMQRDWIFDHYQDLEARYEKRPSLWIEPLGEWGEGHVELVEIPTEQEIHDNIVAYWVPAKTPETGGEGKPKDETPEYPRTMTFAYRMRWLPPHRPVHDLGRVMATRVAAGNAPEMKKFVLDFEGDELAELPAGAGLTSIVTVGGGTRLVEKQLQKNEATGGWRLVFQIAPESEGGLKTLFPSPAGRPRIRLSALLKRGENIPEPLTETWTYDLHP